VHFNGIGRPKTDKHLEIAKKLFEDYCKANGLDPAEVLAELKSTTQEYVDAEVNGTVFEHPNVPNRYFVMVEEKNEKRTSYYIDYDGSDLNPLETALVFHYSLVRRCEDASLPINRGKPLDAEQLKEILDTYRKIASFERFQDGYSHMMEFSANPFYTLQWRRFRKKEDGSAIECPWKDEEGVLKTDMSMGVTPAEGIVVPYHEVQVKTGRNPLEEQWHKRIKAFNEAHQEPFAYTFLLDMESTGLLNHYIPMYIPNAQIGLGEDFFMFGHHQPLETLRSLPVHLFGMKHLVRGMEHLGQKGIEIQTGTNLRIFSNGRYGYVKIEKPQPAE